MICQNHFQLLLRFWQFNKNANIEQEIITKISPLLSHLNTIFKEKKSAGKSTVINTSMISFKSDSFLGSICHKYGIKIFKVCDTTGHTYKVVGYMGKDTRTQEAISLAPSVVMDLLNDYLDDYMSCT